MRELLCIMLGNQHYSENGNKVNYTIALSFEYKIDPNEVKLVIKNNTHDQAVIKGFIGDADKDKDPNSGKYIHFKISNLDCNKVYSYIITDLNNQPLKIKRPHTEHVIEDAIGEIKTPSPQGQQDQDITFVTGGDQEAIEWLPISDSPALSDHRRDTVRIYKRLQAQKPNFFIHLSDMFYGEGIPPWWHLKKLKEYRKHIENDFNETVRGRLASIPSFRILDDHDLGKNGTDETKYQGFRKKYFDKSLGAINEFWPVPMYSEEYLKKFSNYDSSPNKELHTKGLYYKISNGDIDIWFLHDRLFSNPDAKENRLLGNLQRQWLEDTLSKSSANVKFIVTPLPFVMGKNKNEDFRGSPLEWESLLRLFAHYGINAIFSADSHNYSRTDIVIRIDNNKEVIIPHYVVGTFGGRAQPVDSYEKQDIPNITFPDKMQNNQKDRFSKSEVRAYYAVHEKDAFHVDEGEEKKDIDYKKEHCWKKVSRHKRENYGYLEVKVEKKSAVPRKLVTTFFVTSKHDHKFEVFDKGNYSLTTPKLSM